MLRSVALPVEHGGWGFLLEPLPLGLVLAPSWAGAAIGVAAVAAFLARHPLKLALADPLTAAEADHQEIQRLTRAVEDEGCDAARVTALVTVLRRHIEKEIHLVFPLADEWIPDDALSRMCEWYVEHVRERAGRHATSPGADGPG